MLNSKILIIDDEKDISNLIEMTLKSNGFKYIEKAYDGKSGLEKIKNLKPDLILLDLMLPEIDGLTICADAKKDNQTKNIPIIMITAKNEESDIVIGLELGANDYITKPFSAKILLARIRNQLRNLESNNQFLQKNGTNFDLSENQTILKYKNLTINSLNRCVEIDSKEISLTFSEFEILALLIKNQNRVFTRNQLLLHLKGDAGYDISERSIDVQILNLRRKLGSLGSEIESVRGIGYRLNEKTC